MKLSKYLLTSDHNRNLWRLREMNLIAGGTILTTQWDFVFDEDHDPDDDLLPAGTIADEKTVEFDGRHWHEVVYYYFTHDDYPGGPHTHGMRCIVYEAASKPHPLNPAGPTATV